MTATTTSTQEPTTVFGRLDRWLLDSAPVERLAALRILISGFVLVYLLANVFEFSRLASRPASEFEPVGIVTLLDQPLGSRVWLLFGAAILAGSAALVGYAFRFTGPLFAGLVLVWASYHSSWGQMLHFEHLFTLHLLILAVSPAADAWSVQPMRTRPPPSRRYGWPIRLLAITTVVTYCIAGVAKLRISGLDWIDGSTLSNHIGYSATRMEVLGGFVPPVAPYVIGREWLMGPMAVGGVLIELVAPLALLGGRWRRWWVVGVLGFHVGTAATMMVWFPYQGLGLALLPLYRVERIVVRVHDRLLTR
ncbi:MAG: HTTM domain-containing protein [Acidimicrobiia bacterium]|nr:HTTM domain-containing protein [Acidimicrobiia bacterium]